MADFSAGHAALAGFRLTRERPAAIALWAVVLLLFNALTSSVLIVMAGPALQQLQSMSREGDPGAGDPTQTLALLGQVLPAYAVIILLFLPFMAVMTAAATRAVLSPQDDRFGYLRFGGDEMRLMAVLFVVGLILFAAYMLGAIVLGLLVGVASIATGPGGGGGLALLIVLPLLLLLLYLWSRFSLAPALTVSRGAIDVFGSWRLTAGRSGKVFGTLLLAILLQGLVALLCLAIFAGVASIMVGPAQVGPALTSPDMSSLASYFRPVMIVYAVTAAVFGALGAAIVQCPPAAIYQDLKEETAHEVF